MKRFIAMLLLAASATLTAQNFITFSPLNAFSKQPLDSVHATLCLVQGDSLTVHAERTLRPDSRGECALVYPKGAGKYSLLLTAPGYSDSKPREFTVKRTTAYFHTQLGNILLERDFSRQLNEVSVTATKIKMVMKGDTIVYNADAFQLAEGSVLDDLIRQFPGATLDKNGVITVNGRTIESLLVNGRDFFKGDPIVALRNLPAYTVNTVKVYEKEPEYADLVKTDGPKPEYPLVMDVNLKKQFNVGWLGNVEGGYGTHNRYTARAFAMGYTSSTRIGLFANVNNISNSSAADNRGDWDQGWGNSGETTLQFFGANVNWEKKQEKYTHKIDFSGKATREDTRRTSGGAATNFYESGDLFKRNDATSHSRKTHLWASGTYSLRAPLYYLQLRPYLEFMRTDRDEQNRSAQFTAEPAESYRGASIDSLFHAPGSKELERITLLRTLSQNKTIKLTKYMYLNWFWQYRRFFFSGAESYRNETFTGHGIYSLDYPNSANGAGNQYQRTYTPHNIKNGNLTFNGNYNFWPGSESKFIHWQFIPEFSYRHAYVANDNMRYRLDRLEGWGEASDKPLTATPSSQTELQLALDRQNSTYATHTADVYTPGFKAIYGIFWHDETERFYVIPQIKYVVTAERLHYVKPINDMDLHLHRTTDKFEPNVSISFDADRKTYRYRFNGSYNYSISTPNLDYMISTTDDSDPLNVRLGNPSLDDAHVHYADFGFYLYNTLHKAGVNLSANYRLMRGAMAMAQFYDPSTGVSTYMPMNINGNWSSSFNAGANKDWGRFALKGNMGFNYNHSMDYISETSLPKRSLVHNWISNVALNPTIKVNDNNEITVDFSARWLRQYSDRTNFTATSAWDLNYGIGVKFNDLLPWDLKFNTSFQMRSRLGYNSADMNTTDFVWNAQLSRVFASRLTVSVDGFDILGSVKNISRQLNSQGISENWYSALPSYVMLKVAWRFEIFPRKNRE